MENFILLIGSFTAGFFGALAGLGGGIIIVPLLTIYFGIDIRYAIPTSLSATIATSLSSSYENLKSQLVNIRVASVLEMSTVWGALTGFYISSLLSARWLFFIFAFFLFLSAILMFRKKTDSTPSTESSFAKKLKLSSAYTATSGQSISYNVNAVGPGSAIMFLAGSLSALLGVGGGILKTLAMDIVMKMPIKASSATSNFMIGVTSAASLGGYLIKGDVIAELVAPVVIGTTLGSYLGSKALSKISPQILRKIFVVILIVMSFQMILKGVRS